MDGKIVPESFESFESFECLKSFIETIEEISQSNESFGQSNHSYSEMTVDANVNKEHSVEDFLEKQKKKKEDEENFASVRFEKRPPLNKQSYSNKEKNNCEFRRHTTSPLNDISNFGGTDNNSIQANSLLLPAAGSNKSSQFTVEKASEKNIFVNDGQSSKIQLRAERLLQQSEGVINTMVTSSKSFKHSASADGASARMKKLNIAKGKAMLEHSSETQSTVIELSRVSKSLKQDDDILYKWRLSRKMEISVHSSSAFNQKQACVKKKTASPTVEKTDKTSNEIINKDYRSSRKIENESAELHSNISLVEPSDDTPNSNFDIHLPAATCLGSIPPGLSMCSHMKGPCYKMTHSRHVNCKCSENLARLSQDSQHVCSKQVSPLMCSKQVSSHVCGKQVSPHVCGKQVSPHVCGKQVSPCVCGKQVSPHVCGKQVSPHVCSKQVSPHMCSKQGFPSCHSLLCKHYKERDGNTAREGACNKETNQSISREEACNVKNTFYESSNSQLAESNIALQKMKVHKLLQKGRLHRGGEDLVDVNLNENIPLVINKVIGDQLFHNVDVSSTGGVDNIDKADFESDDNVSVDVLHYGKNGLQTIETSSEDEFNNDEILLDLRNRRRKNKDELEMVDNCLKRIQCQRTEQLIPK